MGVCIEVRIGKDKHAAFHEFLTSQLTQKKKKKKQTISDLGFRVLEYTQIIPIHRDSTIIPLCLGVSIARGWGGL